MGLRIALDEVEAPISRRGWRGVATGDDSFIAVQILGEVDAHLVGPALAADLKLPAALFEINAAPTTRGCLRARSTIRPFSPWPDPPVAARNATVLPERSPMPFPGAY